MYFAWPDSILHMGKTAYLSLKIYLQITCFDTKTMYFPYAVPDEQRYALSHCLYIEHNTTENIYRSYFIFVNTQQIASTNSLSIFVHCQNEVTETSSIFCIVIPSVMRKSKAHQNHYAVLLNVSTNSRSTYEIDRRKLKYHICITVVYSQIN